MKPRTPLFVALTCVALAPSLGCVIFFDDEEPVPCGGAADEAQVPAQGFRDPDSGVCEYWGGGGGGGCLGPAGEADPGALPDWASCPGACEGLTEAVCLDTPGCRGAYDTCLDCDALPTFRECWGVAPSGPAAERIAPDGLDAYECSRFDVFVSYYLPTGFVGCGDEPEVACGGDGVCVDGTRCAQVCEGGVCGEACVIDAADPCAGALCAGTCVTTPLPDPAPVCTEEVSFDCFGALCERVPPTCPVGYAAEVADGCYTDRCVPEALCQV